MELLFLYEIIGTFVVLFGGVEPIDTPRYANALLVQALVVVSVALAFFVLQAIALYCMAKKRGIRRKALAFIPFANIILIGRLAGTATFFGQKIKRAGLYAMIAQIIVTAIGLSYIFADVYLHKSGCIFYEPMENSWPSLHWNEGTHFDKMLFRYYNDVVYLLNMIFNLLCEILMLVLLSALYRQYAPEKHVWLTVLTLFVPVARCIILFVLRNRKAVDYQAYMRAKYEAHMRRYQQQYGPNGGYNPYGGYGRSGYGQPNYGQPNYGQPNYGPQGSQPNAQQGPKEEPFSEFASDKKSDDPFAEFSSDKKEKDKGDPDGFFD